MVGRESLLEMARDPAPHARAALLTATADSFLDSAEATTLVERTLFADILVKLYGHARQDVRQKLSAALAMADWAPVDLAAELARDTFEIAQPIITFCPVLNDDVLVSVVRECGLDHRLCVAERSNIGEQVTGALIAVDDERVLSRLAANPTARISAEDFALAMDMLRGEPVDFDTLVSRQDLPPALVATAYSLAGAHARQAIARRLPPRLQRRLTRLADHVLADAGGDLRAGLSPPPVAAAPAAPVKPAAKPTAGMLLAALIRGERRQFLRGVSALLSIPLAQVTRKLTEPSPETVALLARAAGFDINAVTTLFEHLNPDSRGWIGECERAGALVWLRASPDSARNSLASGQV
jgi:uncharacterized protein (DUF2336 family)